MLWAMARAAVILLIVSSIGAFCQAPGAVSVPLVDAIPFAGCYELTMSEWRPKLRENLPPPPSKIQLTLMRSGYRDVYSVVSAYDTALSKYPFTGWEALSPRHIRIFWSTGFVGFEMFLEPTSGGNLKGKAQTFWDYTDRKETSIVTAKRISCEALKTRAASHDQK
jgi:hypothetical protein